jgi:hypothetical protein
MKNITRHPQHNWVFVISKVRAISAAGCCAIDRNVGSYTQVRTAGDFLSSRTAVIVGYTTCCQHGNGN